MTQRKDELDWKMLYKAGKLKRGTAFEIYIDGTVLIKTKITQPGIHIASKIHKWMNVARSSKKNTNSIRVDITVNENTSVKEILKNQTVLLIEKTNGWYIELSKTNEAQKKISQQISSKVTCIIKGLEPTKLFYYTRELLEYNSIKEEEVKQWLLGGRRRGASFNLYQTNTKQLQIECFCSLGNSGRIELSEELGRYIKDWWKLKNTYVVGTINDRKQTILRFSQRKKKKRLVKKITIPYYGARKKVKVVFTHPMFELSEQGKQDLKLTKELQQKGYALKQLTTNWSVDSRHIDAQFEEQVWTILHNAFTKQNSRLFSEVKITSANPPQTTKCLDGLIILEELVGLLEIKTSKKIKNNVLDEVLGELFQLQEQLQTKNIFSLVFINTEVTTTKLRKNITKLYGLANNIILVGKEELLTFLKNPELLINRILDFQILIKNKGQHNQFVHPLTHKLTTKETLEQEAYSILHQSILNPAEVNQFIEQYCFLMNLTKADYSLLYKETAERINSSADFDLELQNKINVVQPIDLEEEILQTLHSTLAKNSNYSILVAKCAMHNEQGDYKILLDHWETISKSLPSFCNIFQFKTFKSKSGSEYEKYIRELLESLDFQVVSNILFSFYGKHFEVDHLIFKNGKMQAISCKDRESFRYLPNLYSKIRFAIGELSLHQKTINCYKSQLYIKVKEEFLPKLNSMFHEFRTETFALEVTK